MTKPITAAAAMILVEEGKLRLDDPVERLLPELADRRVLQRIDGPLDDTVPAQRPITVRDLLTFRMGFGHDRARPAERSDRRRPIERTPARHRRAEPGRDARRPTSGCAASATLPLMHQPGERWMYNTGSDVLGVLIARASGQPLEAFLRERIFEPLGMKDTGFSVPAEKLDRLATGYYDRPRDPERSSPSTSPTGSGAGRPRSRPAPAAWSRPSTTTSPSPSCCWPAAAAATRGSCRGRRSRR